LLPPPGIPQDLTIPAVPAVLSAQNAPKVLAIASFKREQNPNEWDSLLDHGSVSSKFTLSELKDSRGLTTLLHELGHIWAHYLGIDRRSTEQMTSRKTKGEKDESSRKPHWSIQYEVILSERVANVIARLLRKRLVSLGVNFPDLHSLHTSIKTYDTKPMHEMLHQDISTKTIKLLMGTPVDRTTIEIEAKRKLLTFLRSKINTFEMLIAETPPDEETRTATTVWRRWEAKKSEYEIRVHTRQENGQTEDVSVAIGEEGSKRTLSLHKDGLGITNSKDLWYDGTVVNLDIKEVNTNTLDTQLAQAEQEFIYFEKMLKTKWHNN
jgi:hypothetical protein